MTQRFKFMPVLLIVTSAVYVQSQIPQQQNDNTEARREAEKRIEAERNLRMQQMREFDTVMKTKRPPERNVAASPTIDKETGEKIRLARRVDPADLSKYGDFLRADKTGIFKLFPDYDCVTKDVVRIDGDCRTFIFASSSFSFRTGAYIHPLYHDIGFNQGEVYSNAFFSQGILVSLGDVPIEGVTLSSDGLKFLIEFQPAPDPGSAKKAAVKLKEGLQSGGFVYSSHFTPAENTTYALRSIAYGLANNLPPVTEETSMSELRFHTLALDKRADEIVVFRIVRRGSDGSLTIVWKELDRREAPKIKFAKGDKFVDFKPENGQSQH